MAEVLEYTDVLQECRGCMHAGRLKMQPNSVVFKDTKSGRIDNITASDIDKVSWMLRAKGGCIRIAVNSGQVFFFDGLKETDYENIARYCQSAFGKELVKEELSLKGWNWGKSKFEGNTMCFEVEDKPAFEMPLSSVSNCTPGKNEVSIALHQYDDAPISLMEIRFHVPDPDNSCVDMFCEKVMSRADVIKTTGDAIAVFQEVSLVQPRGRYDIKLYPTFLQLHGKSFDYKIAYATILRLFLLPHKDRHVFFVVALDPPIKQGQTRYHFLVCNFDKDQELSNFEVNLPEEDFKTKYDGKLQKEMSGPEFEVFSRVFKALVNRKLTIPGNFKAAVFGSQFLSCSYKAGVGFLYPLERGFMFVPKPPIYIRFEEILSVNFARSQQGFVKSFDFEIETKGGSSYTFSGIDKREYDPLFDYVREKQLPVKNKGEKGGRMYDEDFDEDEEDAEPDHYLERVKAEGKSQPADEESEGGSDNEDDEDDDYDPTKDRKAPKDTSSTSESSGESGDEKKAKRAAAKPGSAEPSPAEHSSTGPSPAGPSPTGPSPAKSVTSSKKSSESEASASDSSASESGSGSGSESDSGSESEESEDERPAKKPKPAAKPAAAKPAAAAAKPAAKPATKPAAPPKAPAKKPATPTGRKRKEKKPKDPNAPKKPTTGFFCFTNEMRPKVKADNPKANIRDLARIMGDLWNKLGDKSKYEKLAKEDRARYEREMAEYNKKGGASTASTAKPTKPAASRPSASAKSADLVPSDADDSSSSASESSVATSADEDSD